MKLTEVRNCGSGLCNLNGIKCGLWYIDAVGNLVIQSELIDEYDNLYFVYLIRRVEDNTFQGHDCGGAGEILSPPFQPINIRDHL